MRHRAQMLPSGHHYVFAELHHVWHAVFVCGLGANDTSDTWCWRAMRRIRLYARTAPPVVGG